MKTPRKVVIPAAGFGTRFLPQTKAMPKEMLPIVDKPTIQYIVEQLVEAGVKDVIFVTGYHKRAIEDHFDNPNKELIDNLRQGGEKKKPLLDQTKQIGNLANFIYLRQKGRYGNATPVLNSAHIIHNEPFIYKWADDLMLSDVNPIKQLISAYKKYQAPCVACIRVRKDEDYSKYGFASGNEVEDGIVDIEKIIEKPGKEKAPSNLGIVFGMILTPDIFPYLKQAMEDVPEDREVHYIDGLERMIKDGKKVYAVEIKNAKYFDTGNPLEYMKTSIEFALNHKDIGEEMKKYLLDLNSSLK